MVNTACEASELELAWQRTVAPPHNEVRRHCILMVVETPGVTEIGNPFMAALPAAVM